MASPTAFQPRRRPARPASWRTRSSNKWAPVCIKAPNVTGRSASDPRKREWRAQEIHGRHLGNKSPTTEDTEQTEVTVFFNVGRETPFVSVLSVVELCR